MKIGVVFPQTEIGQDPAVIRDYAQAVESMGFNTMGLGLPTPEEHVKTLERFRRDVLG